MGFKRLDSEDFVVSSNTVTSTAWSNNQISLTKDNFHTSDNQLQSESGNFYINVYNEDPVTSTDTSEVQFSIAYGNSLGLGSTPYNTEETGLESITPTKSIYGQYRTLIFEDENQDFDFGIGDIDDTDGMGHDFIAINIERARYKEKLLPGTFNLKLANTNNFTNFGEDFLQLTDNSNTGELPLFYGTQRAYQIISGSNGTPYTGSVNGYSKHGSYGLFLPDISVILLNARALRDTTAPDIINNGGCGIGLRTPDISTPTQIEAFTDYPLELFNILKSDIGEDDNDSIFSLNSQETITSDYVFIRTRNSEFNYSENPSFISGSTGEVIHSEFIYNPQSFATTVGLYNDSNELLAVAKLSKPLLKDFTKEALIRVKLDF